MTIMNSVSELPSSPAHDESFAQPPFAAEPSGIGKGVRWAVRLQPFPQRPTKRRPSVRQLHGHGMAASVLVDWSPLRPGRGACRPAPFLPGFDTLGTLQYIQETGFSYSWFILTQKIIKKEFALSGSEQNPDITNKDYSLFLKRIFGKKAPGPVEAFKEHGILKKR